MDSTILQRWGFHAHPLIEGEWIATNKFEKKLMIIWDGSQKYMWSDLTPKSYWKTWLRLRDCLKVVILVFSLRESDLRIARLMQILIGFIDSFLLKPIRQLKKEHTWCSIFSAGNWLDGWFAVIFCAHVPYLCRSKVNPAKRFGSAYYGEGILGVIWWGYEAEMAATTMQVTPWWNCFPCRTHVEISCAKIVY